MHIILLKKILNRFLDSALNASPADVGKKIHVISKQLDNAKGQCDSLVNYIEQEQKSSNLNKALKQLVPGIRGMSSKVEELCNMGREIGQQALSERTNGAARPALRGEAPSLTRVVSQPSASRRPPVPKRPPPRLGPARSRRGPPPAPPTTKPANDSAALVTSSVATFTSQRNGVNPQQQVLSAPPTDTAKATV